MRRRGFGSGLLGRGAAPIAAVVLAAGVVAPLLLLGGGSPQLAGAQGTTAAQRIRTLLAGIPEQGNALGSPRAPVTLEFFGDLQCPTSREFTLGALPFIIRRWVRAGKVRVLYRSLQTSTPEAEVFKSQQVAALAAGMQGRLWYYVESFYHEQGPEHSGYVNEGFLRGLARQVPGLNLSLWAQDRYDPVLLAEVLHDVRVAHGEGFASTPSFLLGPTGSRRMRRMVLASVLEPQQFNFAIERALAQAARAGAVVAARGGVSGRRAGA